MTDRPALAPEVFDPAAYVAMWEDRGNVVFFDLNRSGEEKLAIHFPEGAVQPEIETLRRWRAIEARTPDWSQRVIAFLKTRGQRAGWPFSSKSEA